ncbi:hypothetical protein LINPERHAP2_LOCUS22528 [Linum perenne]
MPPNPTHIISSSSKSTSLPDSDFRENPDQRSHFYIQLNQNPLPSLQHRIWYHIPCTKQISIIHLPKSKSIWENCAHSSKDEILKPSWVGSRWLTVSGYAV